jgi:patatin-like phospholipase/acyl hydrolase
MQRVTILSIDGGGIRGILPAQVLAEIERRTAQPIHRLFDLIAGTSTGGLLALGLTRPKAPGSREARFKASELIELYTKHGPKIFGRSCWQCLTNPWGLFGPKYDGQELERVLEKYFGEYRLHDALTNVLVTAYDTAGAGGPAPAFFKSWRAAQPQVPSFHPPVRNERDFRMREVARATSAAPTYFPPYRLEDLVPGAQSMSLLDGGVFAANPGMCALAEAHLLFEDAEPYVVSLGTGDTKKRISWAESKGWGVARWAQPVLDVIFDGVSDTVEYELNHFLGPVHPGRHRRIQVPLRPPVDPGMDVASPENLAALDALAKQLVADSSVDLDEICRDLSTTERAVPRSGAWS